MSLRAHLPAPCFQIDATPHPEHVGIRVKKLLATKVFKIEAEQVENADI